VYAEAAAAPTTAPTTAPTVAAEAAPAAVTSEHEELVRALYAEYAGPLLSFALRLTGGDRHWAEDVVQETLLRAWRSTGKLSEREGSLRPWLSTVARRIVIDAHRSRCARPEELTSDQIETTAIHDDTDRILDSVTIAEAFQTLSQPHREALTEVYYRQCSIPEAAEALGIPLGTAKSRVYYALRALREALAERGVVSISY
jgi:RNA polymerase sigma-70 factor (ECF subfamily)